MFEKVNPAHPDKIADRIAGALVDEAYKMDSNPKIAVEVLIGHGDCNIISESSVYIPETTAQSIVDRIAGPGYKLKYKTVPQDEKLSGNQKEKIRCGDNGIFRGVPTSKEEKLLSDIAKSLFELYPTDGKYIIDKEDLIICQSNADSKSIHELFPNATINPLGDWEGSPEVDTGATNRKLGSDMGRAVTGGGLHGKDLSKADVSVNIYAHILANTCGKSVELKCAIGDEYIGMIPYEEVVHMAKEYINRVGGFEKLAEWGLI